MKYPYCLCSLEPLSEEEAQVGWKRSCIRKFFGTDELPILDLDEDSFLQIASQHVKSGQTVPGVQKKLSLGLAKERGKSRLTLIDHPIGFILKPQAQLPFFPEAENLVMQMAEIAGIPTAPHGLIPMEDGSLAYITKRIDREKEKRIAMEDFCQLSLHLTEGKYLGSYESLKKVIRKYSARPKLDLVEFFHRLVFCFLTLNSDMHRKNFSLIEEDGAYVLSPAYDLMPVNLVFPDDKEECALTLNGKKKNLSRKDFIQFALAGEENLRIEAKVAERMIDKLLLLEGEFFAAIEKSYLNETYKGKMKELVKERFARLQSKKGENA